MPSKPAPTGTITPVTMTIDRIVVSDLNVRRHRAAITEVAALEASILGKGLIQAINVHPLADGGFGAFAGGRRTRAIRNLVDRGELPADWPVRTQVYSGYSDVELIELSLGENMPRRDLEFFEVIAGIRELDRRGEQIDAIAQALGQSAQVVRRWQRVARLADPIYFAFINGHLSGDDAQAYAATEDQALQLSVFNELGALSDWQRTPEKIRAAMKIGDRNEARLLRLVGDEAYREAGGRFELDIFADQAEHRGRIVDAGLLRDLADARLDAVRQATRAELGREIRFGQARPKNPAGYDDYQLQVTPKKGADGALVLPEGDVFALVQLTEAGDPEVTYWWESRRAKFGDNPSAAARAEEAGATPRAANALRDPEHYAAPAKAAVKEEHGVSSDALEAIRTVRRQLLRALIVEDARRGGTAGRDFATWAQLRALLGAESSREIGAGVPSRGDDHVGVGHAAIEAARGLAEQHHAHDVWTGAIREVSAETFITEPDLAAAFYDFQNAGDAMKRLAGAVLAGMTLMRGANAAGFSLAAHDALAAQTRGTYPPALRRLWSPTAEFLALLPKAQLLAIAEPLIGKETHARWSKVKAAELPGLVAQALNGGGNAVAARNRKAAEDWVHPLLAFAEPDFTQPTYSTEPAEAAA